MREGVSSKVLQIAVHVNRPAWASKGCPLLCMLADKALSVDGDVE